LPACSNYNTSIWCLLKTFKVFSTLNTTKESGLFVLLGPAPTGTGTIALDPPFGSFTLLEPVSHLVNRFLWWKCLDCLDRNEFFGVQSVDTVGGCTTSLSSKNKGNTFCSVHIPITKHIWIKIYLWNFNWNKMIQLQILFLLQDPYSHLSSIVLILRITRDQSLILISFLRVTGCFIWDGSSFLTTESPQKLTLLF
jgi:hypothetical protein